MIRYHTLFCWSVIVEASRPTLECLKAERERVLTWRKTTALVDHNFASSKLISSLIISHPEVTVV